MSEYVELYIDQGATFTNTITINDDNTNLPQNVDGYVVTGQLRKSILSENAAANLVCSVADMANGVISFSIDSGNTANLKAGTYLFDIKYTDSKSLTPTQTRLLEGIFIVSPSITK